MSWITFETKSLTEEREMSDYAWPEEQTKKFNEGLQMEEKTYNEKFPSSEKTDCVRFTR